MTAVFLLINGVYLVLPGLAVYMQNDKQEESHMLVQCEHVIGLTCTSVAKPMSWYTKATLAEDLVFGLQVVLLMAAFR